MVSLEVKERRGAHGPKAVADTGIAIAFWYYIHKYGRIVRPVLVTEIHEDWIAILEPEGNEYVEKSYSKIAAFKSFYPTEEEAKREIDSRARRKKVAA